MLYSISKKNRFLTQNTTLGAPSRISNCVFLYRPQQQEQDPTNLYIANLPLNYKENDLDALLTKYGQVISTRILRDTNGQSKGVGFAR